jgi:methionyl-tRNA synthetase
VCCKKGIFCYDGLVFNDFFTSSNTWIMLALLWSIPWKGVALWKSARLGHKKWFVVLIVINTFALLEIYYIFFVAKKFDVVEIDDTKTVE